MKFNELDAKMRHYESIMDQRVPNDMYMAVRLDGRGFTKFTNANFDKPFDLRFRALMTDTATKLMDCGFNVVYAYTQSDEISLLFHPDEDAFGRKVRKYNSTLAAEASVMFSLAAGQAATFDCRVIALPTKDDVCDYFLWRQKDAGRNALNGWCYYTLLSEGESRRNATRALNKKDASYKIAILQERGIIFDELPAWQRKGVGITFESYVKNGYNPITKITTATLRRRTVLHEDLPEGDVYRNFIRNIIEKP